MPHRLPTPLSLAAALPAFLAVAVLTVSAGCAPTGEKVGAFGAKTSVQILSGADEPEQPPGPAFAAADEAAYGRALRRLIVTHDTWIAFRQTDPMPLLTEAQVRRLSPILAREIPLLRPDQRMAIHFKDRYRSLNVIAELYPEGDALVFHFRALSRRPDSEMVQGITNADKATLVEQPGQRISLDGHQSVLRETMDREEAQSAEILRQKLLLIDQVLAEGGMERAEAEELRALVRDHPAIALQTLQAFLRKRQALQRALEEDLLTQAEFRPRLVKLHDELRQ